MVLMISIHRQLLKVLVFVLLLLGNCVKSHTLQQQQQLLQQSSNTTKTALKQTTSIQQLKNATTLDELDLKPVLLGNVNTNATTSSISNISSTISSLSTSSSTASQSSSFNSPTSITSSSFISLPLADESHHSLKNGGESNQPPLVSSEVLYSVSKDISHVTATTYRPAGRPTIVTNTSPQERERKLMNVLAARRTALHRGNFRTRAGTTGRTATASALIETTSKSPTDPRSICIRNCTKNFTRRTTASCMRQCANFSRTASATNGSISNNAGGQILLRSSSKTGLNINQAVDKDTNEILFTDESSHGLLVIAKEQNDTLNHIPNSTKGESAANGAKYRNRSKLPVAGGPLSVTVASTSIEDDEVQPYVYFGQKLPPLKPNSLTITSVSDEHPRILEVSVTDSTSTTSATIVASSSTLSAVEKSRSRFKYNMRDRTTPSFTPRRSFAASSKPMISLLSEAKDEVLLLKGTVEINSTTSKPSSRETQLKEPKILEPLLLATQSKQPLILQQTLNTSKPTEIISSTPLIITVLGDEMENASERTSTIAAIQSSDSSTSSTTSTTTTTESSSSTYARTSTVRPTTSTLKTSSTPKTTTTTSTTSTTTPTTITTTKKPIPSFTSTAVPTTLSTPKTFINEERISHMDDEDTNIIVFFNRTNERKPPSYRTSTTTTTAKSKIPTASTTQSSGGTIIQTSVLTSIRSTVNPLPISTSTAAATLSKSSSSSTSTTAASSVYEGIVETASAEPSNVQSPTNDISSKVVLTNNENEVSLEMQRMNIATMVLGGIGLFPLAAILLYVARNFIMRQRRKNNEVFDVCITDQQPISPVKKLDSKYHHDDEEDELDHHHQSHLNQNGKSHSNRDHNHNQQRNYDERCSVTSDQEFDRSNIRLKSLLGEGNFGQVWKAEADDLSGHFGATRIVAVKTIRACSAQASLKDEANMMRKLGSHPNVVTLLGACVESEPHMIIMEYAMRGRLLSLLRAARSANNILPASVPGGRSLAPLSPRTLAGFALDIACGMEYIAERRIVHRDLAARNVLLDHNGVCKICDFGMSLDLDVERRHKEQEKNNVNIELHSNPHKFSFDLPKRLIMNHWSHNFGNNHNSQHHKEGCSEKKGHSHHQHGHDSISRRPALPIRWMAPEALQFHIFTTETDIWAFGIVLWEIATLGSTPYSHLTGREVIRRVPNGLRPELPKEGRHEFYNLMSRCWHKDPEMRPSFSHSRMEITRSLHKWVDDDSATSDYMDVSGFSEDLEHGMVYFNHRISEFECEI